MSDDPLYQSFHRCRRLIRDSNALASENIAKFIAGVNMDIPILLYFGLHCLQIH